MNALAIIKAGQALNEVTILLDEVTKLTETSKSEDKARWKDLIENIDEAKVLIEKSTGNLSKELSEVI